MGGVVSAGRNNDELIDNLVESKYIRSNNVEKAFRIVDRGDYFPGEFAEDAYKDMAWKTGNLHISAPCIYCEVMENFELKHGLSILNIGSGTGYLSTLLGLCIGPNGVNHGVDLYQECIDYANQKLSDFLKFNDHYDAAVFCPPTFVVGNGLLMNSSYRKYDRVYCGAGVSSHQEKFLKSLIKVGGILIMPINESLFKYTRLSSTEWDAKSLLHVQFAPLIDQDERCTSVDGLIEISSEPYSLQELSRLSVLRSLGSVEERRQIITDLPIPRGLVRYLNYNRESGEQRPSRETKVRPRHELGEIVAFRLVDSDEIG